MEKATQLKRLKLLRHMMKNHDEIFKKEVELNMAFWSCGTAACALGSAAIYTPLRNEGLSMTEGCCEPAYNGFGGFEAATRFFGITREEASDLFAPRTYRRESKDDGNIKAHEVVKRISKVIKKYSKA